MYIRDAGEEAPWRLRRSRDTRDRPYASEHRQRRSVNVRALRLARVGARHAVVGCPQQHTYQSWGSTPVQRGQPISRPAEQWNGLNKGRLQYRSRCRAKQMARGTPAKARAGGMPRGNRQSATSFSHRRSPKASVLCVRRSAARAPRGLLAKPKTIPMRGMQTCDARKV
jgi:hypothetical protein